MTDLKPDNLQCTILPKIGLKHYKRMMFPIFPVRVRPCPSPHFPPAPPPPPPHRECNFFALPVRNCPLPAELKLRENTAEQYAEYGRTQQALTSIFTSTESMKEDDFASRRLGQKYSFLRKFNSIQLNLLFKKYRRIPVISPPGYKPPRL